MSTTLLSQAVFALVGVAVSLSAAEPAASPDGAPRPLRERIKDEHVLGADHWIYNDLARAKEEARRLNKPIFVTFRCVPCKNCMSFDAEVAKGSELITTLARANFVALRQVEMKGVDLSQFQFDYDLNWAAMFINADGTVYGRYGTQSAAGPDAFNSIASLEKAMLRVLALHAAHPKNIAELAAKHGANKPYPTALDMPGLDRKETLRGQTERGNCIHCHNIHDAEQRQAAEAGAVNKDFLTRWPLPDNVGLHIDPQDGQKVERVEAGSAAARAGLLAGDVITQVNGQPIISIADIQWVLHNLPGGKAAAKFSVARAGQRLTKTVETAPGWKVGDISWRGSMWSLRPRPGFWAPEMTEDQLKAAGVPAGRRALRIQNIGGNQPEGVAAKQAGLKAGDIIVGVDGRPLEMTPLQFHTYLRLEHRIGDQLPLALWRDGKEERVLLPLVK